MRRITTTRGKRLEALILVGALLIASATACGNDSDQAAETVTAAEWVAEFDRLCVETSEALSADLTEDEFAAISATAISEMRDLPLPTESADDATAMLEAIEATTTDPTLDDQAIAQLDQQFLDAANRLGVSDACLYGAPG